MSLPRHARATCAAALVGLFVACVNAAISPRPAAARPQSKASALAPDKGKFRILLDGQPVGSEEFEISATGAGWTARGVTEIRNPSAGTTKSTGLLKLASDGTPLHYEWTASAQKKASGAVDFENAVAHTSIDLGGTQPFLQDFTFPTPRVVVLDNNLYYQYALLARLYDWSAKGEQSFAVLIPQDMTPGNITVKSLGEQSAGGNSLEELLVRSSDLEIELYLDSSHRLMRLAVPSSKVVVERE